MGELPLKFAILPSTMLEYQSDIYWINYNAVYFYLLNQYQYLNN